MLGHSPVAAQPVSSSTGPPGATLTAFATLTVLAPQQTHATLASLVTTATLSGTTNIDSGRGPSWAGAARVTRTGVVQATSTVSSARATRTGQVRAVSQVATVELSRAGQRWMEAYRDTRAPLTITATLTASATTPGQAVAAAALSAASTLTSGATRVQPGVVTLSATATLSGTSTISAWAAYAALSATHTLSGTGISNRIEATVSLVATDTLSSSGTKGWASSSSLLTVSTLSGTANALYYLQSTLSITATLSAGVFTIWPMSAVLSATATLTMVGDVTHVPTLNPAPNVLSDFYHVSCYMLFPANSTWVTPDRVRMIDYAPNDVASMYGIDALADWNRTIRCSATVNGYSGYMAIGFIDALDTAVLNTTDSLLTRSTFWGVKINNLSTNRYTAAVAGGSMTAQTAWVGDAGIYTFRPSYLYLGEMLWVIFQERGANVQISLLRKDGNMLMGTWTVARPPFDICRVAISAVTDASSSYYYIEEPFWVDNPWPAPAATRIWKPQRAFTNQQTKVRALR